MRLFRAALDTCLNSPLFASLSVHGLHFTACVLSNTVSRVLFRERELTEFCGKLGEFPVKLGEFSLAHK